MNVSNIMTFITSKRNNHLINSQGDRSKLAPSNSVHVKTTSFIIKCQATCYVLEKVTRNVLKMSHTSMRI